jgi:hypothetical protein
MATANKNLSNYDKNTIPSAKNFRFGIVVSEWNENITEGLYSGAEAALLDCEALSENIIRWNVPGSFELIYGAKKMITTQNVDAIIVIGEIGGNMETEAAEWIRDNATKPVIGFIAGQTAPKGRKMGHAGAIVGGKSDTAEAKMEIMRNCGIHVVQSPADIGITVKKALEAL